MAKTKKFTGIASEYPNSWWALCDQLPIAAHGETYNEAIQNMIGLIAEYQAGLNGSKPPAAKRVSRDKAGAVPFEITVAAA